MRVDIRIAVLRVGVKGILNPGSVLIGSNALLGTHLGTHQMSSLRSLAFILASAIRRARALSCSALLSKATSGSKMATKTAAKMATKAAVVCIASLL
jgi:hypothetical protein